MKRRILSKLGPSALCVALAACSTQKSPKVDNATDTATTSESTNTSPSSPDSIPQFTYPAPVGLGELRPSPDCKDLVQIARAYAWADFQQRKSIGLSRFTPGTRTQPKDEEELPSPQPPQEQWFEIGPSHVGQGWLAFMGAKNEIFLQKAGQAERLSLQTSHLYRNRPVKFYINEQSLWILGDGAVAGIDPKDLPPAWNTPNKPPLTALLRYNLDDPDPSQTRVEWVLQGQAHQIHKDGQQLSFLLEDTYANPDIRLIKDFVDPRQVDLVQAEATAVAHNLSQIQQIDENRVTPQRLQFTAGANPSYQVGPMIRCDQQLRNGEDFSIANHHRTSRRETRVLVSLDKTSSPNATVSLSTNPRLASVHDGLMSFGQNDAQAFALHHISDARQVRTLPAQTSSNGWLWLTGRKPPYLLVSSGFNTRKLDLLSIVESQGQIMAGSFGQASHKNPIKRPARTPDQLLFLPTPKSEKQLDVVWIDEQGALSPGVSLALPDDHEQRYLHGLSRRLFSVKTETQNSETVGVVQMYQPNAQKEWQAFDLRTKARARSFSWEPQYSFFDESTGRIFIAYMEVPETSEANRLVKPGFWSAIARDDGTLSDPKWIELPDEAPIWIDLPEPSNESRASAPIRFVGTPGPAITIATNLHTLRFDRVTLQPLP